MKTLYSLLVYFLTIMLISCQKEELKTDKTTGSLHIDLGLSLQVNEVSKGLKSAQAAGDFKVILYKSDGTQVMRFEKAADMPDTIELNTGDYYVEAHSDNNLPAAFENPYYRGVSDVFTITANGLQSVRVNCILANTIVSLVYSEEIINYFSDCMTTVSSTLGSLQYTKYETRMGYFQPLPLDIRVELNYIKPDGSQIRRNLSGSIPHPQANRHYQVLVNSSINEGMASFLIMQDSTMIPVEVVGLTEDTVALQPAGIAYGGLLITEIMYDPSALTDTYGEWFEIYNNSDRPVNLQNLVLTRDSLNRHTIADSILLSPGAYYVFKRSLTATDAVNSYVYGSAISLPNTSAVLAIYNKNKETGPGDRIFSVRYGSTGFPFRAGASVSLRPNMFNAADALLGTSWCISTSAYNTGDLGTPGLANDICQ